MKRLLLLHLIIFTAVIWIQCGESIEDPDAPSAPLWVQKTAPTDHDARGIRPYNSGIGIILEWHPNPEEDLSGYKLYKAQDDKDNDFFMAADINAFSLSGVDTFFIDDLVDINTDYYYYLKAYDQAGNKSEPSDTIQYGLTTKVEPLRPSGPQDKQPSLFEWYDYSSSSAEYVLILEDYSSRNDIWISRFSKPNYGDFFQTKQFNFDNLSNSDTLMPDITYRWCIKAIKYVDPHTNIDISGSISNWTYFTLE